MTPLTQRRKWFIAVAVALGALIEVIDASIVNVVLCNIQASFGATLTQVSWVVSGYSIANVIVLPLAAWIGSRIGKKRYFLLSLVGFTAASLLCALASSLVMLVIARVLQGLMGGGLIAKAQAVLYETFNREEHPIAQSFFGAIVVAGPAIGPTLGGYIATQIDWRWIFFVNLPVGLIAVAMVAAALPTDAPAGTPAGGIDWVSLALLAAGIGALEFVLEEGQAEDWLASSTITTLIFVALLSLIGFVWRELEARAPMVDLRVLRHRSLATGSVLSVVLGLALYGSLFAVPLFAALVLNYTPEQTGLLLLPGALVTALCMPLIGLLNRRLGPRVVLPIGCCLLIASTYRLGSLSVYTNAAELVAPLAIRAVGTSMVFMPLNLSTLGPIPKHDLPAATGFFNLTRQLGGSIGVALLATWLSSSTAIHRAVLASDLDQTNRALASRLAALGGSTLQAGAPQSVTSQRALWALDRLVERQAVLRAFNDTFVLTLWILLASLPLVWVLLSRGKSAVPAPASIRRFGGSRRGLRSSELKDFGS